MITEILQRGSGILYSCYFLLAWILYFINGMIYYRLFIRFAVVKDKWIWKLLLCGVFVGSSGMVIWVGDPNLLYTFPVYLLICMGCTKGSRYSRLAVTFIFFCMEMSVCALLDTYLERSGAYYDFAVRIGRTIIYTAVWFCLRKRLPEEKVVLSEGMWKIVLGLSVMPLCSMMTVVVLTYDRYYDYIVYSMAKKLGLAVLPFTFLTSFVILAAVVAFANYEKMARTQQLYEMRESYYQSLKQQETGIRELRHDMRNHLAAVQTLLAGGNDRQALDHLNEMLESTALQGRSRFCRNETANAVLQAKAESITRQGLTYDFRVEIPEEIPVSDLDLCSLIGNALDNAIRAAVSAEDPMISVRCRCDKGVLMLKVINAYAGELEEELRTTKLDKEEHGLGLSRMREIAALYGGYLETRAADHRFELIVCLACNFSDKL